MADEFENPEQAGESQPTPDEAQGAPPEEVKADDKDDEPRDSASTLEGRAGEALRARLNNMQVLGELTLHYPQRSIVVRLDGDSGMRTLAMFARGREDGLADELDPFKSSAANGWLALDLAEPLAMSWLPGLPQRPAKTVVDPKVEAA